MRGRIARSYLIAEPESLRRPREALALLNPLNEEDHEVDSNFLGIRAQALAELGNTAEAAALARQAMSLTSKKENVNEWKRLERLAALEN
ncbi:MAG: hypothetical protein U5J83_04695 [Bryobacterales bacterium]|nr:hypothetical protein [Bryobacterales bacterium]